MCVCVCVCVFVCLCVCGCVCLCYGRQLRLDHQAREIRAAALYSQTRQLHASSLLLSPDTMNICEHVCVCV